MNAASSSVAPRKRIHQKRSQKTYDALVATAFKLLERREFDEISIAELARNAGYSVGAFYARFDSKDELLDAMVVHHVEDRRAARADLFANEPDASLIPTLIRQTVDYYWARRGFWRAALFRSIRDRDFWEPLRSLSYELAGLIAERFAASAERELTEREETNLRFAVQIALGTINNTIINRPGPILMGQELFVENLTRAFLLVSGYEGLVDSQRKPKRMQTRARSR